MGLTTMRGLLVGFATIAGVLAKASCPSLEVSHTGNATGTLKNVSGIEIYHAYPPGYAQASERSILFVSDIYGLPLLENRLLADSLARANYTVIFPDLFAGDAVPATSPEGPALNLTEWRTRHPPAEMDRILSTTIAYMRSELGIKKIGGVGYCWGGKYVPRFLTPEKGIDAGFIAHPSNLEVAEIEGMQGPISIAAGELDGGFNSTNRRRAEDILDAKNATFQTNLYAGAPHGFAVRVNVSNPLQKYAKEGSFVQAVTWFDAWL